MSSSGSEGSGGTISNQLSALVPTFDPATDNVEIWSSKIELLVEAWPQTKLKELATRLILNCSGSAYQKLKLHQKDCLTGDVQGIKRVVELVGGTWGQVPIERRYELVERAIFRAMQKSDETGDSFIARMDVVWAEMLAKGTTLEHIQAYCLLRGSKLGSDDKKRGRGRVKWRSHMETSGGCHSHAEQSVLPRLHWSEA